MYALRTFMVMTESLNVNSVPGNTIVKLTGVVTGVMTNK
jgi:hypothetical protein